MTPEHPSDVVALIGQALYGDDWAGPMSRDFALNERTARRIKAAHLAGEAYRVAPGLLTDLRTAMLAQRRQIDALLPEVDRALITLDQDAPDRP